MLLPSVRPNVCERAVQTILTDTYYVHRIVRRHRVAATANQPAGQLANRPSFNTTSTASHQHAHENINQVLSSHQHAHQHINQGLDTQHPIFNPHFGTQVQVDPQNIEPYGAGNQSDNNSAVFPL